MIRIDGLQLDRDLQVSPCVDGLVYLPEGSLVDFPDDLEVFTHFFWH